MHLTLTLLGSLTRLCLFCFYNKQKNKQKLRFCRWMMWCKVRLSLCAAHAFTHTNPHMLHVTLLCCNSAYCLYFILFIFYLRVPASDFSVTNLLLHCSLHRSFIFTAYPHILSSVWHFFYVLQMELDISKLDRSHKRPNMLQSGD